MGREIVAYCDEDHCDDVTDPENCPLFTRGGSFLGTLIRDLDRVWRTASPPTKRSSGARTPVADRPPTG